jgi:hypothetical protein
MRLAALLIIMLLPTLASADKTFKKTKTASNETWDCATDAVVKITQDKGTFGLLGECKRVTVTGKKNVVTIQSATKVVVGGTGNLVQIEAVDSIAVSGKSNQVTWEKTSKGDKPKITSGRGNTVKKK